MTNDQSVFEGEWRIGESDGVLLPPRSLLTIRKKDSGFVIEVTVEKENMLFRATKEKPHLELVIGDTSFPVFQAAIEGVNGRDTRTVYQLPGLARPNENEPNKLIYKLEEPALFMEISICKSGLKNGGNPPRLYGLVVRELDPAQPGTIERPGLGGWGADKEGGDDGGGGPKRR